MKNNIGLVVSIFFLTLISGSMLSGCVATQKKLKDHQYLPHRNKSYTTRGHNYTFAIYNSDHHLITHPYEDLMAEMKWRKALQKPEITDIYIVSHGWNFTLSSAIANYHNYIAGIDGLMTKSKESNNFQPYFIFVTWTSTSRPTTDLAKAVLPFGIDTAVEPITGAIDTFPLHLLSTWKESLNAQKNALGAKLPNQYLNSSFEETPYNYIETLEEEMGEDTPVSALIYKLIQHKYLTKNYSNKEDIGLNLNMDERRISFNKLAQINKSRLCEATESKDTDANNVKPDPLNPDSDICVSNPKTKIHLVGHSYGAKLITLAGMEALRRWMLDSLVPSDTKKKKELAVLDSTCHSTASDDMHNTFLNDTRPCEKLEDIYYNFQNINQLFPIESLVIINPAFRSTELTYPVDSVWNEILPTTITAPTGTLKFIPRKAIVYNDNDYPDGFLYQIRELPLGVDASQYYQAVTYDKFNSLVGDQCKFEKFSLFCNIGDFLGHTVLGSLTLGIASIHSAIDYSILEFINFPYDFTHHLNSNTTILARYAGFNGDTIWIKKYPVNLLDFVLPIHFGVNESDKGLYRLIRPALGKTGINQLGSGRNKPLNLAGLSEYYNPNNDINADTFYEFSSPESGSKTSDYTDDFTPEQLLDQRRNFYSFDASKVFDTWLSPFGAHSDLRSTDCLNRENDNTCKSDYEKRNFTINFLYKFTKTNFNCNLEILHEKKCKKPNGS